MQREMGGVGRRTMRRCLCASASCAALAFGDNGSEGVSASVARPALSPSPVEGGAAVLRPEASCVLPASLSLEVGLTSERGLDREAPGSAFEDAVVSF